MMIASAHQCKRRLSLQSSNRETLEQAGHESHRKVPKPSLIKKRENIANMNALMKIISSIRKKAWGVHRARNSMTGPGTKQPMK
jgi:hypothetical protein